MNSKTVLYYVLSGAKYYLLVNTADRLKKLKREAMREIEYFYEKRYVRYETWNKRYFNMLSAAANINLLARSAERKLSKKISLFDKRYSPFSLATLSALKDYNRNRRFFIFSPDRFIFLSELIKEINKRVNVFYAEKMAQEADVQFIHGNTPLGVEIEFSNRGYSAGRFFAKGKNDALYNFSKYNYYHLTKFLWRLGAYVDAEMPFRQYIKRGGFLEYTFTKPDAVFVPSQPLTSSPALAANLIEESIKYTPIKPHSLHVTFQVDKRKKVAPDFDDILYIFMCSGHFVDMKETRILEKNMKEWVLMRDRKNESGWVETIEFTHMRACRDFCRRKVYEPSILLLIACKNIFDFKDIGLYSISLYKWGQKPTLPKKDAEIFFEKVKRGLDIEISLPEWYKAEALEKIMELFAYNSELVNSGVGIER